MSGEEVAALSSPAPEHRANVAAWLAASGARCVDGPNSLRCSASAAQIESLLNTTLTAFATPRGAVLHRIHPDVRWSWPAHLTGQLLFLTALTDFPTSRRRNGRSISAVTPRAGNNSLSDDVDYIIVVETLRNSQSSHTAIAVYGLTLSHCSMWRNIPPSPRHRRVSSISLRPLSSLFFVLQSTPSSASMQASETLRAQRAPPSFKTIRAGRRVI